MSASAISRRLSAPSLQGNHHCNWSSPRANESIVTYFPVGSALDDVFCHEATALMPVQIIGKIIARLVKGEAHHYLDLGSEVSSVHVRLLRKPEGHPIRDREK